MHQPSHSSAVSYENQGSVSAENRQKKYDRKYIQVEQVEIITGPHSTGSCKCSNQHQSRK